MIDIEDAIDSQILSESNSFRSKCQHIFDDGSITFADIRDIFTQIFSGGLQMQECRDGIPLMITFKDGEFCIAFDAGNIQKPCKISSASRACPKCSKEAKLAIMNSIDSIHNALKCLDQIQLNKYFANGQNFMSCKLICPPDDRLEDYDNRCIPVVDKVICYNDKFKEVGQDSDAAISIIDALKKNEDLGYCRCDIQKPNIYRIKHLVSSKKALKAIMHMLERFVDGIGWKCSLDQYVQDKYSRILVNKALKHGIDVSRNSEFMNELSHRLSNISGTKPTRSDLSTYAKKDGIPYKTQEYKDFITDAETTADQINSEIIKPIEQLISYATLLLMKNIECYMGIDPNLAAHKIAHKLHHAHLSRNGELNSTPEDMHHFKKRLAILQHYRDTMPSGIIVKYNGKVYRLTPSFGDQNDISKIINYK